MGFRNDMIKGESNSVISLVRNSTIMKFINDTFDQIKREGNIFKLYYSLTDSIYRLTSNQSLH